MYAHDMDFIFDTEGQNLQCGWVANDMKTVFRVQRGARLRVHRASQQATVILTLLKLEKYLFLT